MAELFSDNIIIIYFVVCLGIWTYDLSERQKLTMIYFASYLLCLVNTISVPIMMGMLVITTFFMLEIGRAHV